MHLAQFEALAVPILSTVALAGGRFIAEAKRTAGVELVVLTRENRDRVPLERAARLRAAIDR